MRNSVDWIDPLVWARATQPNAKGFKLGEVAARLEVPLAQAHRATDDAEAAGLVLFALMKDLGLTYREVVQRQRLHANAFDAARSHWRR
jgi:DNA polymerase III alpha subunit (gram-positive type)